MENAEEGEGELLRQTISTTDIQLIELSRGVLNFSICYLMVTLHQHKPQEESSEKISRTTVELNLPTSSRNRKNIQF